MAYQAVGTPVFYVNMLEWYNSQGYGNPLPDVLRTLPVNPVNITSFLQTNIYSLSKVTPTFVAILGHNIDTSRDDGAGENGFRLQTSEGGTYIDHSEQVNMASDGNPAYDGFSIINITTGITEGLNQLGFRILEDAVRGADIGSIIVGNKYTMPHSPDLNLTMTREYGGVKNIQTKGGASLSNDFGSSPTAWGELGAWEIGSYPESEQLGASGRRVFDLSFSYLSGSALFGGNQHIGMGSWAGIVDADAHEGDDADSATNSFKNNILTDDNFYAQVIHRTNGGQLPFIFQPNGDDNTVFAICKFDQSSFKFDQVANGVYSVKLKIREVW